MKKSLLIIFLIIIGLAFTVSAQIKQESGNESKIVSYELSQNYPNPFNPSTTIEFTILQSSFVTLKIYNMLGQEVRTLINELKEAGNYSVKFNADDLMTGMYLYKIQAGNFTQVKKMTLLK